MLASLLPGLRDLRTPLAVGYLWLVGLWLLLYDYIPKSEADAAGLIQSIFQLGGVLGTSALLAALSFIAFIIGIILPLHLPWSIFSIFPLRDPSVYLSVIRPSTMTTQEESVQSYIAHGVRYRIGRPFMAFHYQYFLDLTAQLRDVIKSKRRRMGNALILSDYQRIFGEFKLSSGKRLYTDTDLDNFDQTLDVTPALMFAVTKQLSAVAIQLQVANDNLWDSFDRARAESEFRSAISLPIAVIIAVTAYQTTWWLFLLLGIPLTLLVYSMSKSLEATSTLVQALSLRLVQPPILNRIDEVAADSPDNTGSKIRPVSKRFFRPRPVRRITPSTGPTA